jgi:hypothetical protein
MSVDDNAAVGLKLSGMSLPGKNAIADIASDYALHDGEVSRGTIREECGGPFRPGDRGITMIPALVVGPRD